MSVSNSFFRSVVLRGGENDVALATADEEIAVLVRVVFLAPFAPTSRVRFSFEPQAGEDNIQGDSFLLFDSDPPQSFILNKGQILYVGTPVGVSALVSANAYPISPADAPYLI